MKISPLAPTSYPDLPEIAGVKIATAEAGIKYKNRTDVLLMVFDHAVPVAGVFTKSLCPSASVDWCRHALKQGKARAVLVNSGNANAFTGSKGVEAVEKSADMVAELIDCKPGKVFLASTGVIGEPLKTSAFEGVLAGMQQRLAGNDWLNAARAIMTTDTFPKVATRTLTLDGATVTINGIAKGSGMIAPDMATMLGFIATDAAISQEILQKLLASATAKSFNAVTVDSDTSTSDSVLLFATGAAEMKEIAKPDDKRVRAFQEALDRLCLDLAHQIVRDGEGARKFVSITVTGARSGKSARKIAFSIANSPLVKTAIAGEDANWGRIVMAVGKAGEPADRDRLSISFGDVRVAQNGQRDPDYSEAAASAVMKREEIPIVVDLGLGKGEATVWTCDLTKDYVAINGDYRS